MVFRGSWCRSWRRMAEGGVHVLQENRRNQRTTHKLWSRHRQRKEPGVIPVFSISPRRVLLFWKWQSAYLTCLFIHNNNIFMRVFWKAIRMQAKCKQFWWCFDVVLMTVRRLDSGWNEQRMNRDDMGYLTQEERKRSREEAVRYGVGGKGQRSRHRASQNAPKRVTK